MKYFNTHLIVATSKVRGIILKKLPRFRLIHNIRPSIRQCGRYSAAILSAQRLIVIFMKKILIFLFFLLSFSFLSSNLAMAQQASGERLEALFTIKGIVVDETAANASIARRQAISKAETIAFNSLKEKLVAIDDLPRLANTDFLNVSSLVRGFEVNEERAFANRYMARIDITFNPDSIIEIFTKAGVAFILNAGAELCVAHAHKEGLITKLWEEDNKAKNVWQQLDHKNRLRDYIVAKGTLAERRSISSESIKYDGVEAAKDFGQGCGSGAGLVIFTKLIGVPLTANFSLQYSYWISDVQLHGQGIIKAEEGMVVEDLIATVITKIVEISDENWRQISMVRADQKANIRLLIHTDQIEMLTRVQQKISTLSIVSDIKNTRIGVPLSELHLYYTGSHMQLVKALSQIGFALEPWGEESLLVPLK